ncbi:hypothetical protein [Burkholderia cenocepacia]|uniref:hypothetical protein n=1 Tax=Burkholderia cenocepacia TaxID=95486 RepID=UPI000761D23A|nr:hypothetical protein [Burkholderia cenocepacia]KWU26444.1 hypothetical protein AS149_26000 [Burkholderia cenocepacia]
MSLDTWTKVIILMWPALVLVVILAPLLMTDRRDRLDGSEQLTGHFMGVILCAAVFWFVPVGMALSVPYRGDFDKVEFWASVWHVLKGAAAHLSAPGSIAIAGGYVAAGLVWAVVHFWLYARRLGQQYVMERDAWMRENGVSTLEGLAREQRKSFDKVLAAVKSSMLYEGDFPLRPLQQKRFFAANVLLWPVTLLFYLFADLVLDVARYVSFVLRTWIQRRWESGMAEYLADDALCRAKLAEYQAASRASSQVDTCRSRDEGRSFRGAHC